MALTEAEIGSLFDCELGFSDEKLEGLCRIGSRFEPGLATWATVEAEFSGFGKAFREWAVFPNLFPLYVCSDHGVHWESKCWPNETESPYSTYLTWNAKKNQHMNSVPGKRSFYVPHPWIFYRKKHFGNVQVARRGTLVFFPHSNDTTTPVFEDLDAYINELKALPEEYGPIVVCISYSDIEKGTHKQLRKYGLPLVTAGTMVSQKFVDRFYSMLLRFEYSSSPNIGSHTFYSIEAGVPFFLLGAHPEYHIQGSAAVADGKMNLRDYGDEEDIGAFIKLKSLLAFSAATPIEVQQQLVEKYLGMDSKMTRWKMAFILWREFFFHLDEFLVTYLRRAARLLFLYKN